MANWRELIHSGSTAILTSLNTDLNVNVSGSLLISQSIIDTDGNTGTLGQVLSSTVTGSTWVDAQSGAQGITGAQGTQGIQGIEGIGTQGTQGITGTKGDDGAQGITGQKGDDGAQGIQGIIGPKGETGVKGEIGAQGIQGTIGEGLVGPKGDLGPQGIQGTQGITGTQGIQGQKGEIGAQGTDGSFGGATFDYTFNTTVPGTPSDPGTGIVQLNNSTQNASTTMYIDVTDDNGTSIQSFLESIEAVTSAVKGHVRLANRTDATQFLLFSISDLTDNTGWWTLDIGNQASSETNPFSNNEDIIVSFATVGDRGEKGQKGDDGTQGTQGITGAQGTDGLQGITGTQGIQGITGGDGLDGDKGQKGDQG
jgi:hypothetical protein